MTFVSLEEFRKIDLRIAKVIAVDEIPGADRLWKLTLELGEEKKEIVAGIKLFYSREVLLGKLIVVVNNLEPAQIRGVSSQGMLLAAKSGGEMALLTLDKELPTGALVG
jgi:methionyl-tRNA synthetase